MHKYMILTFLLCYGSTQIEAQSNFSSNAISVGVVVSDMEASKSFYTDIIGMKETPGFSIDPAFGRKSGLSGGAPFDVTVLKLEDNPDASQWKLVSFGKDAKHPTQKHIQDDTGMQYITIFVKSLEPILARIKENNIDILSAEPTILSGGRHFVLIQDPDGTFVELIGNM